MILDLSQFQEEYFEIPFPDGGHIKVKKPTEKIFIDFLQLSKILSEKGNTDEEETEKYLNSIDRILLIILNNNADMRVFTKKDINWMSIDIKIYIINQYSEFMNQLVSDPN